MTGREDSSSLSEILFRAKFKEEITVFTTKGVFSFTILTKVRKFLPTIKLFQIYSSIFVSYQKKENSKVTLASHFFGMSEILCRYIAKL